MILPGKLSIGFLQEDNPLKFYFRIRPLVAFNNQGCEQYTNLKQDYPDDGYIRIVPDKNEIGHFKTRMRSMGCYCRVNLVKHPNENDKIRPNKNHGGEFGDKNAYIMYSDVIDCAEILDVAEVIEAAGAVESHVVPKPGTPLVMLRRDDMIEGPYGWAELHEEKAQLHPLPDLPPISISTADVGSRLQCFTLEQGRGIELLFELGSFGIRAPSREGGSSETVEPIKECEQTAPTLNDINEERKSSTDIPDSPQTPVAAAELGEHRPWLQPSDPFAASRVTSSRLNLRQRALQMQSGLNPMRGRSINDVIDEQWRQSRYEQLGHPVPPEASSTPALSPYEKALSALREAWALSEDMRRRLTGEIMQITGIHPASSAADSGYNESHIKRAQQSLEELEAERISLAAEIESLTQKRQYAKERLIIELERDYAARIRDSEQKLDQLKEMIAKNEQQAANARELATMAESAMSGIMGDGFDEKATAMIAEGRVRDFMNAMAFGRMLPPPAAPKLRKTSSGVLINDLYVCFDHFGISLDNDEAVNLLACLHIGKLTLISGATGSGKSLTARLLALALGLMDSGRYAEIQANGDWTHFGSQIISASPNGVPIEKQPKIRRLLAIDDGLTPTMLMIDDANRAPIERYAGELLEYGEPGAPGALSTDCGPIALNPQLRMIMTICDDGDIAPLTAKTLDRAFMIRLDFTNAQIPKNSRIQKLPFCTDAVALAELDQIFDCARDIPDELTKQLDALRSKLSDYGVSISRRAIADINRYLAAVLPITQRDPKDTLDLAIAQRALPAILASVNLTALHALPELLTGFPKCQALMTQPLPLMLL